MSQTEHCEARKPGVLADAALHNRLAKRIDNELPAYLGIELVEACPGYLRVQ
jgi:hypothetical protein